MSEPICKNCVNTGVGWFNKFCSCKHGLEKQKEYIQKFGFSEEEVPKVFEFTNKFKSHYTFEDAVNLIVQVKNSFR